MKKLKIIAFAKIALSAVIFSGPALSDVFITQEGACKIYAENSSVELNLAATEATAGMRGLPKDKMVEYFYRPMCDVAPDRILTIRPYPGQTSKNPFGKYRRDGQESKILYATSDNCKITVEYWVSGGYFRNDPKVISGCRKVNEQSGWKVTSKVPSDQGTSYFIRCNNGKAVTLEYNKDLEPLGYFVELGKTFSSLDEAARYRCSR